MSVRRILQYSERPSHALAIAEFWIRLLVESESAHQRGHVLCGHLTVRKTVNTIGQLNGIVIEPHGPDVSKSQCCLSACEWWLRLSPFGTQALPVTLICHEHSPDLVLPSDFQVIKVDLRPLGDGDGSAPPIDLACLGTWLPRLEELDVSCPPGPARQVVNATLLSRCEHLRCLGLGNTDVVDLTAIPLERLESLSCVRARGIESIQHLSGAARLVALDVSLTRTATLVPLQHCHALHKLSVSGCSAVRDLTPLTNAPLLEELNCSYTAVSDLQPLQSLPALRWLSLTWCRELTDFSPLAEAHRLEVLVLSQTNVTDLTPLQPLRMLRVLNLSGCFQLSDLAPLASSSLHVEALDLSGTGVHDLSPLRHLTTLRTVFIIFCRQLGSLAPLAGLPELRLVDARLGSVTDIGELEASPCLATLNLRDTPCAHRSRGLEGAGH